jgi:hypothetical protein
MDDRSVRLNITLPADYAAKLSRLADRVHLQEGSLARSLLSNAIDEADPDSRNVADLLDSIAGAWDRAQEGLAQVRRHDTVALDEI